MREFDDREPGATQYGDGAEEQTAGRMTTRTTSIIVTAATMVVCCLTMSVAMSYSALAM